MCVGSIHDDIREERERYSLLMKRALRGDDVLLSYTL